MGIYASSDARIGDAKIVPRSSEDYREVIREQLKLFLEGDDSDKTALSIINYTIHRSCVKAGWWYELGTETLKPRNFGELMALIMSEMMEGYTADPDQPDDKLPAYPMVHAELADTFIRLSDLGGAAEGENKVLWEKAFYAEQAKEQEYTWDDLFTTWLAAFEAGRKKQDFYSHLGRLQAQVLYFAVEAYNVEIDTVIAEKWFFNQSRLDHQMANRLAEGGKSI